MTSKAMKNTLKVSTLFCLIVASLNTMAAPGPSTNLSIKGTVKTGACMLTLDNGGVVDYGNISTDDLNERDNQLEHKYINLNFTCATATTFTFSAMDNRNTTESNAIIKGAGINGDDQRTFNVQQYGLGKNSSGHPIGAFAMAYDYTRTVANGKSVRIMFSNSGSPWGYPLAAFVNGDNNQQFAFTSKENDKKEFIAVTTAVVPVKISAALSSRTALGIKEQVHMDGNATFSINYL